MARTMALIDQILPEIERLPGAAGRPAVTLSYAQSLDGSIAARRGFPLQISGTESAQLTHQLRAVHDAILVGIGTVLADDPRLTVRHAQGKDPQPVVLDSQLRFPLGAKLLRERSPWIATTGQADGNKARSLTAAGAVLLTLPADCIGRVHLLSLLARLCELGIESLMVEGGAAVITSFLRQQLVDFAVLTIAPIFVGGLHATEDIAGQNAVRSAASPLSYNSFPKLQGLGIAQLGDDLIVWGKPEWPGLQLG